MMEYNKHLSGSPLDKQRKSTNSRSLLVFVIFAFAYILLSIYAFKFGDLKNLENENILKAYHKATKTLDDSKWTIAISVVFSVALVLLCLFLIKLMTAVVVRISVFFECLVLVSNVIMLYQSIFSPKEARTMPTTYAFYTCFILMIHLYTVYKVGVKLISHVIKESCRAILESRLVIALLTATTAVTLIISILIIITAFYWVALIAVEFTILNSIFFLIHTWAGVWILVFITSAASMITSGTLSTWYCTVDKSSISSNIFNENVKIAFRYHMGTVAYSTSPWGIFLYLCITIKNIINNVSNSTESIGVRIGCWISMLESLYGCILVPTAVHGLSFKKSADTVSKLYLRHLLRYVAIIKVNVICSMVLSILMAAIVMALGAAFSSNENQTAEENIYALIPYIVISLSIMASTISSLYAAVNAILYCALEEIEQINDQESSRPCCMDPILKNLLMSN